MENYVYILAQSWSIGTPFGQLLSILRVIGAVAIVALLAYFTVKMMALSRGRRGKGGNLYVVESIIVGSASMVQIVKAGNKYLVIGVTKERVTFLAELDDSQVSEPESVEVNFTPFDKVLRRYLGPKENDIDIENNIENNNKDPQQQGDEDWNEEEESNTSRNENNENN